MSDQLVTRTNALLNHSFTNRHACANEQAFLIATLKLSKFYQNTVSRRVSRLPQTAIKAGH